MAVKHRVYDDRTDETLFESYDIYACWGFLDGNYDEDHEDYPHVWMETFEVN